MPATKLELLIKILRKQIKEYGKTNQVAAQKFQEMLEKTIQIYHERRKHLSLVEAGETQEKASEDLIKSATEQALTILSGLQENRESFRKVGLTFEEKAFYDILVALRDQYNFEYGVDKNIGGIIKLIVADLNRRLSDRDISIRIDEDAEEHIIEQAYDPIYGARPLKRYIQKYVETLSAKLILADKVEAGDVIRIVLEGDMLKAVAEKTSVAEMR